jgi:hypothetical protein
MKRFGAGPMKRIWINKDAAARREPSWVVHVEGDSIYTFRRVTIVGEIDCVDAHTPNLEVGPAYWVQTTGKVIGFEDT